MPAISPRKFADCQRDYANELQRLADLADLEYRRNLYRQLYIVGRKQAGLDTLNPRANIWTELTVTETEDGKAYADDWHIVNQDAIPRNLTTDGLYWWMKERLGREPLWIFAD